MFTIVDVVLEVNPDSLSLLQRLARNLTQSEFPDFPKLQTIPHLHFMSMQVFEDAHFDPLFLFENNFDGDPALYWPEVLRILDDDLRAIFACTKPAVTEDWAHLFTGASSDSLLPFINHFSLGPSASHIGAVGISAERVGRDSSVFDAVQSELGVANNPYASDGAVAMHGHLRKWALAPFPWLNEPDPAPIATERQTYRFSTLRPLLPLAIKIGSALLLSVLGIVFLYLPYLRHHSTTHVRDRFAIIVGVATLTILLSGLIILVVFGAKFSKTLRHLETSDYTQSKPTLDPQRLADFALHEDQIVQNHLGSMVLVKPGSVRSMIIHAALYVLRLYVPLMKYDGYLGSMRTIHFAHWTLIGNGGRMLFLSNFDGSWQSYLDDFVDKAAFGLTLAWGNCVGFPPTKDLFHGGAAQGTQFKAWARQSQTISLLWYSAYRFQTVNQILRNAAIVDGLRKPVMTAPEATQWAALL